MSNFVKNEVQTFCYKGSTGFLMSFKCLALSKTKSKPLVTKGALSILMLGFVKNEVLTSCIKGSTFFNGIKSSLKHNK